MSELATNAPPPPLRCSLLWAPAFFRSGRGYLGSGLVYFGFGPVYFWSGPVYLGSGLVYVGFGTIIFWSGLVYFGSVCECFVFCVNGCLVLCLGV